MTVTCTTILQLKKKEKCKKKKKRPDRVSHCRGHETSRTRFWCGIDEARVRSGMEGNEDGGDVDVDGYVEMEMEVEMKDEV